MSKCPGVSVPSSVSGLQVSNLHSSCCLQVTWEKALGVADGYVLQVMDDRGSVVMNTSEPYARTQHRFEGLTPGKKYRVLVQTNSGGVLSPGTSAESRTRKGQVSLVTSQLITSVPTLQDFLLTL